MTASAPPPVPPETGPIADPAAGPRPGEVDFQLVQRTVAGDQKAFELLVIKYQRRIERLIGRMVINELVTPTGAREWRSERELGLIAGTRPIGLGRFFARFEEDCDGTIGVSETKLPGHTAHTTLPVSHMGMLTSRAVADQVGEFLTSGRFRPV